MQWDSLSTRVSWGLGSEQVRDGAADITAKGPERGQGREPVPVEAGHAGPRVYEGMAAFATATQMLDPSTLPRLRDVIQTRAQADRSLLDELRAEIRPLKGDVRRISPRSTTAVSLVATDGGNNKLQFDPFLIQLVRVVDSYGKEFFLDAVSPTTDTTAWSERQFNADGSPKSALGRMMNDLGVKRLYDLSPMIPRPRTDGDSTAPKPSWVLVYRDLCEWAVVYDRIVNYEFGTDTLIVLDGQLRSKLFAKKLFIKFRENIDAAIKRHWEQSRRRVYMVGFAKHTQVLQRYQLAMNIEGMMQDEFPCYLKVPREIEAKAYQWPEYARGSETESSEGEAPKFVMGTMFFAKFGGRPRDPIWSVDVLDSQVPDAALIFGYLLADSIDGFPVPFYPRCLQRAHEAAALVDFDMDVLQEEIYRAVRSTLPAGKEDVVDAFRLNKNPAGLRYG